MVLAAVLLAASPPVRAAGVAAAGVATTDVAATVEFANRLELGIGVAADPARAMVLYCQAALGGNRGAVLHVAAWLLTDDGPDYDPGLAAAWLRRLQRREHGLPPPPGGPPRCPGDLMVAAPAETGPVAATMTLVRLIEAISAEYGVDPDLVKAVITVESNYRIDAVSTAGAQGLMQLMPATAHSLDVADPFDAEQNLRGGIAHLARLLEGYDHNLPLVLAAYNAGESRVDRCRCVPAIAETTAYVDRILTLYPTGRGTVSR
ncbi:lytic transglycosylase domain-containing protein [Inquilinus sp. CA228]|uniref:lytic transglycosylase domain-containing protein n=1 Tax=Inquilinus sp. CA228 TaxID=3455609 RepID=UPI003F8D128E